MSMKTRAVAVGCGGMSPNWLNSPVVREEVDFVGLVDLNADLARQRAKEFGLEHAMTGSDLAQVLAATQPEVVFDITVPSAHECVTLTALQHGCHVLGEKPLADSMEAAQRMVAAARKAGKLYAVTQNYRYNPHIRRLRAFLDSGAIGRVHTVQSNFFVDANFGADNFRAKMPHVLILDMSIHTFDAARFLTGANPTSVYCEEWNPPGSYYQRDASAVAVFAMSHDVRYIYHGSWTLHGAQTGWNSHWLIYGEQGSVQWDGGEGIRAYSSVDPSWGNTDNLTEIPVPAYDAGAKTSGHDSIIREFLACVREGGTPETIAEDNINSLAMVQAAIASSEQGARITITPEGAFV